MSTELIVQVRNVYGNETVYPVCEKAKLFASLSGKKTLTHYAIKDIKALGYTFKVQQSQGVSL